MAVAKSSNLHGIAAVITAVGGVIAAIYKLGNPSPVLPESQNSSVSSMRVHRQDVARKEPLVEFSIRAHLNEGELSKHLSISLDGTHQYELTLDKDKRSANLILSVSSAGAHSYVLDGTLTVLRHWPLSPKRINCAGQGHIDVQPGQVFEPRKTIEGATAHFWLEPTTETAN